MYHEKTYRYCKYNVPRKFSTGISVTAKFDRFRLHTGYRVIAFPRVFACLAKVESGSYKYLDRIM